MEQVYLTNVSLLPPQEEIQTLGYAIQCRITTEDPTNDFMPDSGTIIAYRSSGGFVYV